MSENLRITTTCKNLSDRFTKLPKEYKHQYYRIYTKRLEHMTSMLTERVSQKWGSEYPTFKLHKLPEVSFTGKCVVIGTLFKDQKLKPSLLKQLSEANHLLPQPILSHFTDESDVLYLEDEVQRYCLVGVDGKELVTGITCAVLGRDIGIGKFEVDEICFADFGPQIEYPLLENDMFVVILSGLNLVGIENSLMALQIFVNWISGLMGSFSAVEPEKISRLIIAGNSIRTEPERAQPMVSLISRSVVPTDSVEAVKNLDSILSKLAEIIDVDLLPGKHDPSNHTLPQKPMHHCMFPKSHVFDSLHQVSNPYECVIEGVRILGSSGQPVTDILNFSDVSEPIEALENCLKWRHIAPTAPDTLGSFPFYESDPFIIENCPHVMFAGNQEKFDTKIAKGATGQKVRLICVPQFTKTGTVAVFNLKNLDCFPVVFKCN